VHQSFDLEIEFEVLLARRTVVEMFLDLSHLEVVELSIDVRMQPHHGLVAAVATFVGHSTTPLSLA
jgi:hypothetical protein